MGLDQNCVDQSIAPHPDCPFCPGNESRTPHAKQELCDELGQWLVRVVANRYPAFEQQTHASGATGIHEVIIESREHASRVSQITAAQWRRVLQVHAARLDQAAGIDGLRYALLIKNVGASGGASLVHLHSQFIALPEVPAPMQTEIVALRAYHDAHGNCGWCDRIAEERAAGDRIVAERDGFIALCPAAARQPFETWILSVDHEADFRSVVESDRAAAFIHDVLCRVERLIGQAGYNVMVLTCPFHGVDPEIFHWRVEILPRISPFAGLELATGINVCTLAPERAAPQLASAATPNTY